MRRPAPSLTQSIVAARVATLRVAPILTDPGPRDLDVIACLVEELKVSPATARKQVDEAPCRLAPQMTRPAARRLAGRLHALGAQVAMGGLEALRAAADKARADVRLDAAGPDPEGVALALVALTGADLATARAAAAGAPVIVARRYLPVRARRLVEALAARGAAATALPAAPKCCGKSLPPDLTRTI